MTDNEPLFHASDLRVTFSGDAGAVPAVQGIDLELRDGETIGVVGESGSGKSVTMLASLGFLDRTGARIEGSATYRGRELLTMPRDELRGLLGSEISFVFQDPMSSLNPVYPVGWQIVEQIRAHRSTTRQAARARAAELLDAVGIPNAKERLGAYPHEFSGGMRQRVMIAMALSCEPRLLVADEPTTALDVTVQEQILDLLAGLQADLGLGLVLISHDLGVIAGLASRVYVMRSGMVVESGEARAIFAAPQHEYTRKLLAAVPRLEGERRQRFSADRAGEEPTRTGPIAVVTPVLEAVEVRKEFSPRGIRRLRLVRRASAIVAVDDVDLVIRPGETVAVVGESGSGKSTLARALIRLSHVTDGRVAFAGSDITRMRRRQLRNVWREMQMVFQDPFASLNPRHRIGDIVAAPLRIHRVGSAQEIDAHVADLLGRVGLSPDLRNRFPRQLSGGQRQRVSIARALALRPRLIVADEAVSALDVSVRAEVLDLLKDLQDEYGIAYLFIAHDLGVVRHFADRVAVMYRGAIVEQGLVDEVFAAPRHEYTKALLSSIPVPDPDLMRERRLARAARTNAASGPGDRVER